MGGKSNKKWNRYYFLSLLKNLFFSENDKGNINQLTNLILLFFWFLTFNMCIYMCMWYTIYSRWYWREWEIKSETTIEEFRWHFPFCLFWDSFFSLQREKHARERPQLFLLFFLLLLQLLLQLLQLLFIRIERKRKIHKDKAF